MPPPSTPPVLLLLLLLHTATATATATWTFASLPILTIPALPAVPPSTLVPLGLLLAAFALLLLVYFGPLRLRQVLAAFPTQLLAVAKDLRDDWAGIFRSITAAAHDSTKEGTPPRTATLASFLDGVRYLPGDVAHAFGGSSSSSSPAASSSAQDTSSSSFSSAAFASAAPAQDASSRRRGVCFWLTVAVLCAVVGLLLRASHEFVAGRQIWTAAKAVTLKDVGEDPAQALLHVAAWTKKLTVETAEL